MYKFDKQKIIPKGHQKYFKVETSLGFYDFRLPLPTRYPTLDLVAPYIKNVWKAIDAFKDLDGSIKESQERFLKARNEEYYNLLCVFIGSFWSDRNCDLTSVFSESLIHYGKSVFIELDDEGWTLEDIERVGTECFNKYLTIKGNEPSKEDIKERLNFFGQVPV